MNQDRLKSSISPEKNNENNLKNEQNSYIQDKEISYKITRNSIIKNLAKEDKS